MNTDTQIQIHFPQPGEWDYFQLTALWRDAEGYDCRREYRPEDIPAAHRLTLQGIVEGLVGLDAPWQATHVIAVAELVESGPAEAVLLELHARRADGACRSFTHADYPQLRLTAPAVLTAFWQIAGGEQGQ